MLSINTLDPSQAKVLESLLDDKSSNSDFSVVYGPPGTGKSHLIISLLFELAKRNKKVLFVSQNTEALDVIERMYRQLKDDYELGDYDASFLNFCLMLHKSSNTKLKYIKQLADRLRMLDFHNTEEPTIEDAEGRELPYALTRNSNESSTIMPEDSLSVDELVKNYIHNVNHEHLLSAPIKNIALVDTRGIFNLLDTVEGEFPRFAFNNKPVGALAYIAKTAPKSTELETLYRNVAPIKQQLRRLLKDSSNCISSKRDIYVMDLLQIISDASSMGKYVKLNKLQKEQIDSSDFVKKTKHCVKTYNDLEKCQRMIIPEGAEKELFVENFKNDCLGSRDDFDEIVMNSKRIINACKSLKSYGVDGRNEFERLLSATLVGSEFELDELLRLAPGLAEMGFIELEAVRAAVKEWTGRSGWYKAFHDPGEILIKLQEQLNYDTIEKDLPKYDDLLRDVASVLEGTSMTFGELNDLLINNSEQHSLINPLNGVNEQEYYNVLQQLLILQENCSFIDEYEHLKLDDINDMAFEIADDVDTLRQVIELNNESMRNRSLQEAVADYNAIIRNNRRQEELNTTVNDLARYFRCSDDKIEPIISIMMKFIETVQDGEKLQEVLNCINIDGDLSVGSEKIQNLSDAISASLESGIFTDEFYMIKPKAKLESWGGLLDIILEFQDPDALDNFLKQRELIDDIREKIGQDNAENVDEYLAEDGVSFDDFREKITVDLVRAEYYAMSADKRRIVEDNYFDAYKTNMIQLRKDYYASGIYKIMRDRISAIIDLKSVSSWMPGMPVMDQIRNNTEKIVDAYPIIIATPKEVSKYLKAKKDLFDYVVFDEASQLLPGQALPSIYRAKKAVVIGDPHQMPPTLSTLFSFVQNNDETNFVDGDGIQNNRSILDIAIELAEERKYHLMVHYRSKYNVLFEPSREAIYKNDGIRSIMEACSPVSSPIIIRDNLGDDDELNFPTIANSIAEYHKKYPNNSACLLFTTMAMQQAFEKYITEHDYEYGEIASMIDREQLLVSTVTNCQGIQGEKTFIYFQHYERPGGMWFFRANAGAYKRLNVSITRQREELEILMAEPRSRWMDACEKLININAAPDVVLSANLLKLLFEYARHPVTEERQEELFGSNYRYVKVPLVRELYYKLCKHYSDFLGTKIKIWCDVGWGLIIPNREIGQDNEASIGYKLDLAVYSLEGQKYILGIEVDSSIYSNGEEKQFVDEQRRDVLNKLKGWNTYRVWSTNWLKNPDEEFAKLIKTIDSAL